MTRRKESRTSVTPRRGGWFAGYAMVLTAMAAGMGWGIRGQFGHETGAMIAGVLTAFTLVMLFAPHLSSPAGIRAAAMMAVAIGIGGSMTYGQTIGLTHDPELAGHWGALWWGMLGLFVKGSVWIGFGALFLGMGLSGVCYRAREMALLMIVLLALAFLGAALINTPFDPEQKQLPWIYFSDQWHFEPDRALQPRKEVWGGLLVALLAGTLYTRWYRRDHLAGRMAWVGMLAGGLGFSGGQSIQAFHRWSPEVFTEGALSPLAWLFEHFNWWNMMETCFGMIFGAGLALGLWCNRRLIRADRRPDKIAIAPRWEVAMVLLHLALLMSATFSDLPQAAGFVDLYVDHGLLLAAVPMIGVVGGRFWPFLLLLPVSLAPIAGKTLRQVSYHTDLVAPVTGWIALVAVPIAVTLSTATWLARRSERGQSTGRTAACGLLVATWLYFVLNTVFFDFAWPWKQAWTMRTPNQAIFGFFALVLTISAIIAAISRPESSDESLIK